MATPARGWSAFRVYLEVIKFGHSVFALPFALVGMIMASVATSGSPWPGWRVFGLIVVAMVSCRSAAMAFNRIVDRDVDAANPRTSSRAIPAGLLHLRSANVFLMASLAVFLGAAGALNRLSLALAPVALLAVLGYSLTKRFTPLCHLALGFSLGIAPAAAWIAVTGQLDSRILWAVAAVTFWTAGFDILYSLQDEEFDRANRLRSAPVALGARRALVASRVSHVAAVGTLAGLVASFAMGWTAWIGVVGVAGLLAYEQSLVRSDDLSRIDLAFFTLNGYVSIGFLASVLADVLIRGRAS